MKRRYLIKPSNPNWGKVLSALVADIDANVRNGKDVEAVLGEPVRDNPHNAALHALCTEISKQKEWCGKKRSGEDWKRIFVQAYASAEGLTCGEMVPSLDGSGVVQLGIQTRSLPNRQIQDLIQFISAWAAENDVRFTERRYG